MRGKDYAFKRELNGFTKKAGSSFNNFASAAARLTGRPATFLAALTIVLVWAAVGPFAGYSDTWQLVINTSTTIITFLMVFLIQHTQNRDTLALQIKVAELVLTMRGAESNLAVAEDLSEESLQRLHEKFKKGLRTSRTRKKAAGGRGKPAKP
jgi:low affinity Fe/Cu permease